MAPANVSCGFLTPKRRFGDKSRFPADVKPTISETITQLTQLANISYIDRILQSNLYV